MKRAIINHKAVLMTVRLCIVIFATSILISCRHKSESKIMSWIPGTTSEERLTIARDFEQLPATPAGTILTAPGEYEEQSLLVDGYIGSVELRELPRDMTALVLLIHDPIPKKAPSPIAVAFVPEKLELGKRLAPLPGELMVAAEFVDPTTIDPEQCLNRYFRLKSAGSRMRALSNYFAGNQADELAASADRLASGLQTFAEGYQAIASITPASKDEPLNLEARPTEFVTPVAQSKFDMQIKAAADLLEDMTEKLINNRDGLISGRYAAIADDKNKNAGFVLLSAGNLYEAAAWRNEGKGDLDAASLDRKLSLAYVAFGEGINALNLGSQDLAEACDDNVAALALSSATPAPSVHQPLPPMLKCAIIGWNKQVLADAATRLESLGNSIPIQVRGKVFRGNFREEMDQTWVAMQSVHVDGLAINLDYDDDSRTGRRVNDLYRWVSSTAD